MTFAAADRVHVLVLDVQPAGDRGPAAGAWYSIRLRHRDSRDDRPWSYCDLRVRVPDSVGQAQPGDVRSIVLAGVAVEACEAMAGGYSCKVREAGEPPPFPVERAGPDQRYAGLIQRAEPPNGGAILLHMGSGLTCYPELAAEAGAEPAQLGDGEWWELVMPELRAICFEPVDPRPTGR